MQPDTGMDRVRVRVRVRAKVRYKILYTYRNTLALNSIPALNVATSKNVRNNNKITIPFLADGVVCLHRLARLVFRIFNGFVTTKNKLANCKIVLKVILLFWAFLVIICTRR